MINLSHTTINTSKTTEYDDNLCRKWQPIFNLPQTPNALASFFAS